MIINPFFEDSFFKCGLFLKSSLNLLYYYCLGKVLTTGHQGSPFNPLILTFPIMISPFCRFLLLLTCQHFFFKIDLESLYSIRFCLSEKLFSSLSTLNDYLVGYTILSLGCRFFISRTLNVSYHSLLACKVSGGKVS